MIVNIIYFDNDMEFLHTDSKEYKELLTNERVGGVDRVLVKKFNGAPIEAAFRNCKPNAIENGPGYKTYTFLFQSVLSGPFAAMVSRRIAKQLNSSMPVAKKVYRHPGNSNARHLRAMRKPMATCGKEILVDPSVSQFKAKFIITAFLAVSTLFATATYFALGL